MYAEYLSSNSFRVLDDETSEFIKDRRVKLNCGVDGIIIASVVSSVYDLTHTVVVIDEEGITSNLVSVLYSVVKPGQEGNIPSHSHSSDEGEGGELDIPMTLVGLTDTPNTYSGTYGRYLVSTGSGTVFKDMLELSTTFLDLDDTPITYSGTEGSYLQSTGSGTVWATISGGSGGGTSDVQTFLDLDDTPTTYSGGQYLRTTTSGIQAIDGIILKAPNESEWLIKVTNSGTLYTVEV
jgi:hypothetical protein